MKGRCQVRLSGVLPRAVGATRRMVVAAAEYFAARSAARCGRPFRAVEVTLQDDEGSAAAHEATMGVSGATDVITQGYDPLPGEAPGVYGELLVNAQRAVEAAPRRPGWSPAREILLYIAHGMDHLSGADDRDESGYARMRRRELGWLRDFGKISRDAICPCAIPADVR